jgi:aryl-alcohol dehydrogenase-like predicted oxidoreductase
MRYITAGGARMSVIGVGTWQFASRDWGYGADYADSEADKIISRALDLGVNVIDTAEAYAFGKSERIVGRALGSRRPEAFVATKVTPIAPIPPIIAQRGRASLRRLGVDVIDLYQIHQPNRWVPLSVQVGGLRRLLAGGLVRHVGVSNYSLDWWQSAENALGSPIISNQVGFSLAAPEAEQGLVPWAAANDRVVIAHTPLGRGLLSCQYDETKAPTGGRATYPLFGSENMRAAAPLLSAVREIAKAHTARPAQIAVAWVIRRPNVVAIPGASSVAQLEQNVAAVDIELSPEEDARLTTAAHAFQPVWAPPGKSCRVTRKVKRIRSQIRALRAE